MTAMPDVEPISDDEILLRRIPVSTGWYEPSRTPTLEWRALLAEQLCLWVRGPFFTEQAD
jgi:hypothetical protein